VRLRIFVLIGIALTIAASPSGAAVLTTINIDGNMDDWAAVLADPYQTSLDGPLGPLPDLDAPLPSPSRDAVRFAWTYDSTDFYFHFTRAVAASGRHWYFLYFDTNADGLMQSGEPVIHLTWWGNSRATRTSLYQYNSVAPGGDPLGDAAGLADGWTLPGSATPVTTFLSARGGARDRTQVESRVPWSLLGVAPGTPIYFHVSSAAGPAIPGDVADNMGGPGGLIGSTGFVGVEIVPSSIAGTVVAAGSVALAHTVINTSAASDTINLRWTSSGDFAPTSVSLHHDADGDGLLSGSDPLLLDTNGDTVPDTGPLASGAGLPVLVVLQAPLTVNDGDSVALQIIASSSAAPAVQDVANDTVQVVTPALTLVKAVSDASAPPGTILSYTLNYLSSGTTTAYSVVIVDEIPAPAVYQAGSATGAGATIEFSHDGGSSFDGSEAAPVTHIRWSFAAPIAPGESGQVSFQALIP
jgi:hypothetical protein